MSTDDVILYGRHIEVKIEPVEGEAKVYSYIHGSYNDCFSIEFDVVMGLKAAAFTVKLYNVLKTTVDLCKPKVVGKSKQFAKISLSAGYGDDIALLASGDIASHEFKVSDTDSILEIKSINSISKTFNTLITKTFTNQTASQILESIFKELGINSYSINIKDNSVIPQLSLNDNLSRILDVLCKKTNTVYYSVFGKFYIESVDEKKGRASQMVLLDRSSGLIGRPEFKGVNLNAKSLLNPKIQQGEVIRVEFYNRETDEESNFDYKVVKGKHVGGSRISNYYTEFEARKV